MRFKLNKLTLQFQRSTELIDLTAAITFFHGKISSGKSTILHLVDACLGGKLPRNTAILQEFVSARLDVEIGEYSVIFERLAGSNQVQVSWLDKDENGASVLAPLRIQTIRSGRKTSLASATSYSISPGSTNESQTK